MNSSESFNVESDKKLQQISFAGASDDREVDIFNFHMDVKLEEYRRRMKNCAETEKDVENNENYLDSKYKLHIGNAVRFKGGAVYKDVFESLKEQDREINEELFDNAWAVISKYVKGEETDLKNGSGFRNENGQEVAHILRIEVGVEYEDEEKKEGGCYKIGEVYEDPDGEKIEWHYTKMKVLGDEGGDADDNREKVLAYVKSKYGKQKELIWFSEKVGDSDKPYRYGTDKYF